MTVKYLHNIRPDDKICGNTVNFMISQLVEELSISENSLITVEPFTFIANSVNPMDYVIPVVNNVHYVGVIISNVRYFIRLNALTKLVDVSAPLPIPLVFSSFNQTLTNWYLKVVGIKVTIS